MCYEIICEEPVNSTAYGPPQCSSVTAQARYDHGDMTVYCETVALDSSPGFKRFDTQLKAEAV